LEVTNHQLEFVIYTLFKIFGNVSFRKHYSGYTGKIGQLSPVVGNPYLGVNQKRVTAGCPNFPLHTQEVTGSNPVTPTIASNLF